MTITQEAPEATRPAAAQVSRTVPETARDLASLIVHGRDRAGIVVAVGSVLSSYGANIVSLYQHSDNPDGGAFFQRTVFNLKDLKPRLPEIEQSPRDKLGNGFSLNFALRDPSVPERTAIFASKSDHCLLDLPWRQRRGELAIKIPMVISNHPDVAEEVRSFGVPFFYVQSSGPDKPDAEAQHLRLLKGNVDFIVLARYMQILSSGFIDKAGVPIINIHHPFLPAFIGAGPYAKARETRRQAGRRDGALRNRGPLTRARSSSKTSSALRTPTPPLTCSGVALTWNGRCCPAR
jgi:formyltetrahydrofolate deformylase